MKVKTFLAVIFVINISMTVASQTTDCMKDFDYLIKKIQSDYPGYNDKVTNANRLQLTTLEKEIRQKITNHPDSCGYYLSEYTDFFKDRHLRIIPNRKGNNQQTEIMDVSTYGKNLYINTDSLQQATVNEKGIEGVWEGFWEKFVVTQDEGKFVGIAVNNQRWKSGQVLYEFEPVNEDYYLDLLFYHRRLKCLIAIELKLGKFNAAYKGQMELYLRWLDKNVRIKGENSPIGLILCAGKNNEHVELLQLDNSNIKVADYLTQLPDKHLLEQKLRTAIEIAKQKFDK